MIKDIGAWINCKHRRLDYYLTQALTGHGVYREYARRFGKDTTDQCIYCQQVDTVDHTIFRCSRWNEVREAACAKLGTRLNGRNTIELMTSSAKNWNIVHKMIQTIMKNKEKEERERQAGVDVRERYLIDRTN